MARIQRDHNVSRPRFNAAGSSSAECADAGGLDSGCIKCIGNVVLRLCHSVFVNRDHGCLHRILCGCLFIHRLQFVISVIFLVHTEFGPDIHVCQINCLSVVPSAQLKADCLICTGIGFARKFFLEEIQAVFFFRKRPLCLTAGLIFYCKRDLIRSGNPLIKSDYDPLRIRCCQIWLLNINKIDRPG